MTDNENPQSEPEVEGQTGRWGMTVEPEAEQAEVEGQWGKAGYRNVEPDAAAADRKSSGHGEVEGQWSGVKRTDEPEDAPSDRDWGKGSY